MKTKAIICDLDGTLIANPNWDGDFVTFYEILDQGYMLNWCYYILKGLVLQGIEIIFLTARDEKCRDFTISQLKEWLDFPFKLYMRRRGDLTIDHEMKEKFLKEILEKYDVLFSIDDNFANCTMFKKYVPTLFVT